jgi:hypothetical protein
MRMWSRGARERLRFDRNRRMPRFECAKRRDKFLAPMNEAGGIAQRGCDVLFARLCELVEATPLARLINNATLCKPLVGATNRLTK